MAGCGQSGAAPAAPAAEAPAAQEQSSEESNPAPSAEESAAADESQGAEGAAAESAGEEAANEEPAAQEGSTEEAAADGDVAYIKGKGTLIVGITDFAPMDYQENGEWVGFDADMAEKVAEDLGVSAEFVEIDWDNKILELNNKSIDVVWNGMTLTDEVKSAMECTEPYCNNAQVVVVPSSEAEKYKDIESLKDLSFAVEAGSAGESAAKDNSLNFTAVPTQADTLMEVKAGTSDASIIDLLMAGAMVGEGTSYEDLTHTVELTEEKYVVGCRKGSDLAQYINDEFKKFAEDGSLETVAKQYGVQDSLVK
ncbi:MAG: transporter substrate-binding domain-containing protein [Lachnospiraceae bacterium]|nr:transporter substrate-binding domain-containing protein [Lachnospiraceae bacterium]